MLGKKRLKDAAKDGDNKAAKKARKLAELSGPKNSIVRHLQSGVHAVQRMKSNIDIAR
jgi:hypothetical protein